VTCLIRNSSSSFLDPGTGTFVRQSDSPGFAQPASLAGRVKQTRQRTLTKPPHNFPRFSIRELRPGLIGATVLCVECGSTNAWRQKYMTPACGGYDGDGTAPAHCCSLPQRHLALPVLGQTALQTTDEPATGWASRSRSRDTTNGPSARHFEPPGSVCSSRARVPRRGERCPHLGHTPERLCELDTK
jgi:hypothetical protein